MEKIDLIKIKEAIFEAIKEKDYEICIDEPNNLSVRRHSDGTEYIVVYDMDSAKSSTYFGECTLYVAEHSFTCNLGYGEWRSDVECLLKDEEVMDAIMGIDGMLYGEMTDMDSQVEVYNKANGTSIEEYYWCEDDECPMDPDYMNSLEDFNWNSYEFENEAYYLVDDEIFDADDKHEGSRWGYGAYGDPDDFGKFECVILLFNQEDDTIVGIMDSNIIVDNEGNIVE